MDRAFGLKIHPVEPNANVQCTQERPEVSAAAPSTWLDEKEYQP